MGSDASNLILGSKKAVSLAKRDCRNLDSNPGTSNCEAGRKPLQHTVCMYTQRTSPVVYNFVELTNVQNAKLQKIDACPHTCMNIGYLRRADPSANWVEFCRGSGQNATIANKVQILNTCANSLSSASNFNHTVYHWISSQRPDTALRPVMFLLPNSYFWEISHT